MLRLACYNTKTRVFAYLMNWLNVYTLMDYVTLFMLNNVELFHLYVLALILKCKEIGVIYPTAILSTTINFEYSF